MSLGCLERWLLLDALDIYQDFPELAELRCDDFGRDGSVSVLLSAEEDEVRTHGEPLTVPELGHAQLGGHVLVRHLVSDTPSHVHDLGAGLDSIDYCSEVKSHYSTTGELSHCKDKDFKLLGFKESQWCRSCAAIH